MIEVWIPPLDGPTDHILPSLTGWIGVDLDNTLAHYSGDVSTIGAPIEPMAERVRQWIREGRDVRIFTARVAPLFMRVELHPSYPSAIVHYGRTGQLGERTAELHRFALEQERLIQNWCEFHLGKRLPVTAVKDMMLVEFWDDRAVAVEPGTGRIKQQGSNPE